MKTIQITLAIFIFGIALALSGCTKEAEPTPDSGTRSSFLGKWNVSETWTKLSYETTISADPNSSNGVFISNFAGTGTTSVPASAVINGSSIILDANQVIGGGLKIIGTGNLAAGKISWNYTLDDGANIINAIAIYSR